MAHIVWPNNIICYNFIFKRTPNSNRPCVKYLKTSKEVIFKDKVHGPWNPWHGSYIIFFNIKHIVRLNSEVFWKLPASYWQDLLLYFYFTDFVSTLTLYNRKSNFFTSSSNFYRFRSTEPCKMKCFRKFFVVYLQLVSMLSYVPTVVDAQSSMSEISPLFQDSWS